MNKHIKTKFLSIFLALVTCFSVFTYTSYAATNDPVYDSMTKPSESMSDYMIKANRKFGRVYGSPTSPEIKTVISMGAIYPTSGETLPDKFQVYLGKITLFAYSKSQKKWIVIDNQAHPTGIFLYTLPWTSSVSTRCKNVEYKNDIAVVNLTAKEMKNSVLHFWGNLVKANNSDYIHYACAYKFWTNKPAVGKLSAAVGIDGKDSTGSKTVLQLFSSRGLASSTTGKVHWGHTVPTADYNKYNPSSLNALYQNSTPASAGSGSSTAKPGTGGSTLGGSSGKTVTTTPNNNPYAAIDGFQIQYSKDSNFKSGVTTVTIALGQATDTWLKNLKSGQTYYIRQRTYKNSGSSKTFSSWSGSITYKAQ